MFEVEPAQIEGTLGVLNVPCRCALDGEHGFCDSVLGTETMVEALASVKALL